MSSSAHFPRFHAVWGNLRGLPILACMGKESWKPWQHSSIQAHSQYQNIAWGIHCQKLPDPTACPGLSIQALLFGVWVSLIVAFPIMGLYFNCFLLSALQTGQWMDKMRYGWEEGQWKSWLFSSEKSRAVSLSRGVHSSKPPYLTFFLLPYRRHSPKFLNSGFHCEPGYMKWRIWAIFVPPHSSSCLPNFLPGRRDKAGSWWHRAINLAAFCS